MGSEGRLEDIYHITHQEPNSLCKFGFKHIWSVEGIERMSSSNCPYYRWNCGFAVANLLIRVSYYHGNCGRSAANLLIHVPYFHGNCGSTVANLLIWVSWVRVPIDMSIFYKCTWAAILIIGIRKCYGR